MAWAPLSYGQYSTRESSWIVSCLQLFIVKELRKIIDKEEWVVDFQEEMEMNAEVSAFKYIFPEERLDSKDKYSWALNFMKNCQQRIQNMTKEQFSTYIEDDIINEKNFNEVKYVLNNYIRMMQGEPPIIEFYG